jgi:hypothetical protein
MRVAQPGTLFGFSLQFFWSLLRTSAAEVDHGLTDEPCPPRRSSRNGGPTSQYRDTSYKILIQRAKKGRRKIMKRGARMRSPIPSSAASVHQSVSASAVTSLSGLIGRFYMAAA